MSGRPRGTCLPAWLLSVALGVGAGACFEEPDVAGEGETDDVGSDASGDEDGSTETPEPDDDGAMPQGEPQCVDYGEPCTECEMQACPDLFCDCYDTTECGLLAQCILLCPEGDVACAGACALAFPQGTAASALLADCAAVDCSPECAAFGTLTPLTSCERCAYEACPVQMNACAAVADCPPLVVCVTACAGDAACELGCGGLYPAGIAAAQSVGDCSAAQCASECF